MRFLEVWAPSGSVVGLLGWVLVGLFGLFWWVSVCGVVEFCGGLVLGLVMV